MSTFKSTVKRNLFVVRDRFDRWMNGSCAVLLYHRVTHLKSDPQLLSVTPENFEAHLMLLKKKFRVLSVDEFTGILLSKKKFPQNSVLLTFDDGYADNYLEALPLLEKHQIQALFYIATGTLNTTQEFWWDAVERILFFGLNPMEEKIDIAGIVFDLRDDRNALYQSLLPVLRKMTSSLREEKIDQLASCFQSREGRSTHRAMDFDELKAMSRSSSAVIGAHTHLHPSLGHLSKEDQKNEIIRSKHILEERLGYSLKHFSYPFGTRADFNEDSIQICKEAGFQLVAANYPHFANRKSNPFAFPRHLVRDWNVHEFEKHLTTFI